MVVLVANVEQEEEVYLVVVFSRVGLVAAPRDMARQGIK